jgi:transcriptional regulator with XRE-family HTH domain
MSQSLHSARLPSRGDVCTLPKVLRAKILQNDGVKNPRKPAANHLRAWREYRRLTQADLAEAVGTSDAVISLIEAGARGLSDKWLRRLAPALNTTPGHLLDHDPNEVSVEILDIWATVPAESRGHALEVLRTFVKTGTND